MSFSTNIYTYTPICPHGGDHTPAFTFSWIWARLAWTGLGRVWVVEGDRQLEMGANVECEELGCVVGGPFKPNKLREVQGLVWKPWINKQSEMTMRCAHICHHTTPASKYKPCKTSFPPSPSPRPAFRTVPLIQLIPSSLYLLPHSIVSTSTSAPFILLSTST